MKKLAIIIASIMLLASASGAFAGGAGTLYAEMNSAYHKWQQKEAKFWKKFDADIAKAEKNLAGKSKTPLKKK